MTYEDLSTEPPATPSDYDSRVCRLEINDGLPLLPVQWSVFNCGAPLIGCFGSYRSGKTRGGSLKILQIAAENPWRAIYGQSNPTSVVITESLKVIRDSTYREMMSVVPSRLILKEWKSAQNWRLRLVNGHDIVFRPWLGKVEGLTAIGVWIDEAHKLDGPAGPQELWKNFVMRSSDPRAVRRCTIATGLPEYGWLSEIFDQPNTPERTTLLCSLTENYYLDEETVRVLRASTTAEEADVVILGRWRKPPSVVYYAFSADNVVNALGNPSLPVDLSIDLGDKGAILVTQPIRVWCRDSKGHRYQSAGVFVVDEILPEKQSVRDALLDFFKSRPWIVAPSSRIYVDPKADRDELAAIRDLTGAGKEGGPRIVRRAAKEKGYSVEYGIRAVNSAFRDYDGNKRLLISASLPRSRRSLIPALLAHKRKPNGQPYRDNVTDHILDTLRYVVSDRLPLRSESARVFSRAA